MMRLSSRHWLAALATAMTIHVGIVLGLLWQMPDPGAKSAGIGGIEVSLGPAGGGGGATSREADAARSDAPSSEPPPEPSPPVKTQEPVTEPTREPKPEPKVEQAKDPVTPEQAEPAPDEEVSALSESKPPERIPEPPKPPPEAEPPPPAEPPATTAKPAPQPPPRDTEATKEAASERTAALTSSTQPSTAEPGRVAGQDTGSGDATSGGGSPGAVADYAALIRAWLERHKRYPRRARLRRLEGTAMLYFVMDRKGRVLSYRIQRSAGSTILDREVEAMIERAKPLPEMPEDMHQARLELVVPVTFSLR